MVDDLTKLKVLVIEDKEDARAMIKNMLTELGITQVFEASDGKQGMDFMDMSFDFVDIILCDWNMPSMSGMDLLKQLRSVDPDFPFLMITGRGDISSVSSAKAAGVSGYVLKPFSMMQLEAKLRVLFHRHNLMNVP